MANVTVRFTKWIIDFESTANETAIRNRLLGLTYDTAKSIVEQHLANIGELAIAVQAAIRPNKLSFVTSEIGDFWHYYPRMFILGETDLTEEELAIEFDTLRVPFQSAIRTGLLANPINAFNIRWFIKLHSGEVQEQE